MTSPDFKKASSSQVIITELMIPAYANFSGKIHGGITLSSLDKVACASRHAGGYCVTVFPIESYLNIWT